MNPLEYQCFYSFIHLTFNYEPLLQHHMEIVLISRS